MVKILLTVMMVPSWPIWSWAKYAPTPIGTLWPPQGPPPHIVFVDENVWYYTTEHSSIVIQGIYSQFSTFKIAFWTFHGFLYVKDWQLVLILLLLLMFDDNLKVICPYKTSVLRIFMKGLDL